MCPFLGADLDGNLRAGAHGPASDQLQVDQHRAGGGQLRGRQVDLDVREKVRAVGLDPSFLQHGSNGFRHYARAASVEVLWQRVDIDANGGGGHPPL